MTKRRLPAGKLPVALLRQLLETNLRVPAELLVPPAVGEDAGVIDIKGGALVAATDPITLTGREIGGHAVVINANDVAVMGVRPRWFLAVFLLPVGTTEADVTELFEDMQTALDRLGATLVGGHTEITSAVTQPIIVGQMLGFQEDGRFLRTAGVRAGDAILQIGAAPIEGAAVLANEAEELLREREIGFLLLRVGQGGCDGGAPAFADSGAEDIPGTATDAPDRRHPDRQAVEIPEGTVSAYFSAIVGVTAVNPAYLGTFDKVVAVARDGTEIPDAGTAVEVVQSDDAVRVTVAATSAARSLLLFGDDGVVRLVAGGGKGGLDGFLGLRDETIDIRDGRLGETVSLPPGLADPAAPPAAHRVTIGRQRARVVAVRAREIAVAADDLRPPAGATTEVAVTGPSGARVAVQMPAWGYRILVQPVTNTRLWVPVRVQITGLGARERVVLRFTPDDTQSIEPAEVRLTGAQARLPLPVAELRSSRIGTPRIKATVLRER